VADNLLLAIRLALDSAAQNVLGLVRQRMGAIVHGIIRAIDDLTAVAGPILGWDVLTAVTPRLDLGTHGPHRLRLILNDYSFAAHWRA
jgi:hypothetical protein